MGRSQARHPLQPHRLGFHPSGAPKPLRRSSLCPPPPCCLPSLHPLHRRTDSPPGRHAHFHAWLNGASTHAGGWLLPQRNVMLLLMVKMVKTPTPHLLTAPSAPARSTAGRAGITVPIFQVRTLRHSQRHLPRATGWTPVAMPGPDTGPFHLEQVALPPEVPPPVPQDGLMRTSALAHAGQMRQLTERASHSTEVGLPLPNNYYLESPGTKTPEASQRNPALSPGSFL